MASIEVGRPQPGNPYPVFLIPDPYYNIVGGVGYGRIRMFRGTPVGTEPYGSACTGTSRTSPRMGIRDLQGSGVRMQLSDAAPNAYAVLALGLSRTQWNGVPLPFSLAGLGLPGCSLFASADFLTTVTAGNTDTGAGYASIDLPWPLRPPTSFTFVLHGQWFVFDPATRGAAATEAHLWRH